MSNKSGPFQRLFPTLSTKLRTTRSEFMFITVLLLIPAFPLVILRGASWIGDARIVFLHYIIWLPICGLWLKSTKTNTKLKNPRTNYRSGTLGAGSSKFLCIILPLFLLLTFTVIAFYIPLKQRFWVGIDEGLYFGMKGESFWSSFFDLYLNRPLTASAAQIAFQFSSDTISGFLWLGLFSRFLCAVLVYGIANELLKRPSLVPVIAAILFVVNPSEDARFLVIYMQGASITVPLLLLSVLLYIRSFKRKNRFLLILSCIALGYQLLAAESGYPLDLLVPFVLFIAMQNRRNYMAWCYAWYGTIALCALRYILFLLAGQNYQTQYTGRFFNNLSILPYIIAAQLYPTLSYFYISSFTVLHLIYGLIASASAVLILLSAASPTNVIVLRKQYAGGIVLSSVAIFFAIAAFIPIGIIAGITTLRTQFYAAPAQAMFWACLIGYIGCAIPHRNQAGWFVISTGFIVLLAAAGGMAFQVNEKPKINPDVRFEMVSKIFKQAHEIVPRALPNTVILFVMDKNAETLLGDSYHLDWLAESVLQVRVFQANAINQFELSPTFDEKGVTVDFVEHGAKIHPTFVSYSELIVIRIDPQGNATLMDAFPRQFLPPTVTTVDYDPQKRIIAETPQPLKFLR